MGVCRICQGGQLLFGGGACDAWRRHTFAGGVRRHALPKKKFNGAIWCVLEHIFIIFFFQKGLTSIAVVTC